MTRPQEQRRALHPCQTAQRTRFLKVGLSESSVFYHDFCVFELWPEWDARDITTCCIGGGWEVKTKVMMGVRLSMAMEFSWFCIYPHFERAKLVRKGLIQFDYQIKAEYETSI